MAPRRRRKVTMSAFFRRLAKALHIHIWGIHPYEGSKGYVHLLCRCGQGKQVAL